jgi:MoaA/NifB/PqqE/SkfB family radical SAM enzyme
LKDQGCKITLLSTGLLLPKHAESVVAWCDDVIVSLDGSRPVHDAIRRIPRAYDRLAEGVAALKARSPFFRVAARCVIQQANFRDMPYIVDSAHMLGLDQISFLPVDVSSEAFNRPEPWDGERVAEVALSLAEVSVFGGVIEDLIVSHAADFTSGFIAESPDKLRRLPIYFAAVNGAANFPETTCNAPWVSTVIEADGAVRPCFFHRTLGNIHDAPLDSILNSPDAIAFRRRLDVKTDETCRRCVCTLHLAPHQPAP